jgi:hypothetical protein
MRDAGLWSVAARTIGAAVILGGVAFSVAASADDDLAIGSGYGSDNLSYARWCSEIQKYPADRCAAPTDADRAAYKATLDHLQAIEVEAANKARQDRDFNKLVRKHDDPYRPNY